MYTVELYARVRRAALVEGRSQRTVAREFGLARKTVRKMLAYSAPPGSHHPTDEDLSAGTPLPAAAADTASQAGAVAGRDRCHSERGQDAARQAAGSPASGLCLLG